MFRAIGVMSPLSNAKRDPPMPARDKLYRPAIHRDDHLELMREFDPEIAEPAPPRSILPGGTPSPSLDIAAAASLCKGPHNRENRNGWHTDYRPRRGYKGRG